MSLQSPHHRNCISIHTAPQARTPGRIPGSSLSFTDPIKSISKSKSTSWIVFKSIFTDTIQTIIIAPLDRDLQQVSLSPTPPFFSSPYHHSPSIVHLSLKKHKCDCTAFRPYHSVWTPVDTGPGVFHRSFIKVSPGLLFLVGGTSPVPSCLYPYAMPSSTHIILFDLSKVTSRLFSFGLKHG